MSASKFATTTDYTINTELFSASLQDNESARTLDVLDVDGWQKQCVVFVGVLSSSWRRRAPAGPAPPRIPSPRGRHGRPGPGSSEGGALSSADHSEVAMVADKRCQEPWQEEHWA